MSDVQLLRSIIRGLTKMSYSRFCADSDVYVFYSVNNEYICCGCQLRLIGGLQTPTFSTPASIVLHMQEHVDAGHKVPEYLLHKETFERD